MVGTRLWTSCQAGELEQALGPQDGGEPLGMEVPGNRGSRGCRPLGRWCQTHRWCVLAVLVALAVAVAVPSAGGRGGSVAPVLGCAEDWVGYRNVCYYRSELAGAEGSWGWSWEQCSLRGASLAMPKTEGEMEFLQLLSARVDHWLGLLRRGERLQWLDGSNCTLRTRVVGAERCLFLTDRELRGSSCSQARPYLCSKPRALLDAA
ncbi:C-type lectin domain family 2 member B-like [Apus apus]|uniref:C-type lectin domain family 2 member B-like n=1 Tax=Apus apus TaxID=8895 RepID=UPI0021F849BE|nr:C-type lectin domain family 2 member B-like [Apus apus]